MFSLKEQFFIPKMKTMFFQNFNASWVIYKQMTKNGTIYLKDSCRKEIIIFSVTLWNMKCSKFTTSWNRSYGFPLFVHIPNVENTFKILYDWKHLFGINLSNSYSSFFFIKVCHNKECVFTEKSSTSMTTETTTRRGGYGGLLAAAGAGLFAVVLLGAGAAALTSSSG